MNATADGFTFCIQGAGPTALGAGGGALGYAATTNGSNGIPKSIAITFDLYDTPGNDSTGLYVNGARPTNAGSINLSNTGINLHSGHVFNVTMTYDGGQVPTLQVTIRDTATGASASQSYAVNIPSIVGASTAYVGFTGATGGLTADQRILSWSFATTPAAPTGLVATPGSGTIVLNWNASPGASSYDIYRSTSSGGEGATPIQTGVTSTSFTDTSVTSGTTYYYEVTAVNLFGDSTDSSEVFASL